MSDTVIVRTVYHRFGGSRCALVAEAVAVTAGAVVRESSWRPFQIRGDESAACQRILTRCSDPIEVTQAGARAMAEPIHFESVPATGHPEKYPRGEPATFALASESDAAAVRAIAVMFAELGQELLTPPLGNPFDALTRVAAARVAGAQSASITTLRAGRFRTESATGDRARLADALQYELGSGPCLDAIVDGTLYHPIDLREDQRWPEFGRRVHAELGVTSMVSYRLNGDFLAEEMIAGLNLYSDQSDAFTPIAIGIGSLLATHGAMVIAAELNRDRAVNLEVARDSNREIGLAMGVLMTRYRITRDQALDLLRITSQRSNRKLREIAVEVGDTGILRDMPT